MQPHTAQIDACAQLLDEAARTRTAMVQLTERGHMLSLPQAYAVQQRLIALREARGERLVGVKMGFTSDAKRVQMKIDDLIWGRLTDGMLLKSGSELSAGRFIHPRVEPEIAFLLKKPLSGNVSAEQALSAVAGVAPALEILDSRYRDFRFSLADVIADNSSSAAVVLGDWQSTPRQLTDLAIVMAFDARPVQSGSSAAIMGDPLRSLMAAARLAGESGLSLQAGWLVMAGGATAAEPLPVGARVSVEVTGLGSAQVQVLP
jgi:2-oxo-3-hexenedioate decarboxylase